MRKTLLTLLVFLSLAAFFLNACGKSNSNDAGVTDSVTGIFPNIAAAAE